jgi:hypothetical protein
MYRAAVLDELARHGLAPRPETPVGRCRDHVRDLYLIEIRRLRDRCRAGDFPIRELPERVVELRRRYVVLSVPIDRWTC